MTDPDGDDFYMVLPSNVDTKGIFSNKTSHFITPLAKPLELPKDQWECALAEISFPTNWYAIDEEDAGFRFQRENPTTETTETHYYEMPPGFYRNGGHVAYTVNASLRKYNMQSTCTYVTVSNRFAFDLHQFETIRMKKRMAYMLGFYEIGGRVLDNLEFDRSKAQRRIEEQVIPESGETRNVVVYDPYQITAPAAFDLSFDTHYLYVYCNLIKETIVGTGFSKLLRAVSTKTPALGQYTCHTFFPRHYIPLSSSFETLVEISIRTDAGDLVKFQGGKSVVTLHFKRRR